MSSDSLRACPAPARRCNNTALIGLVSGPCTAAALTGLAGSATDQSGWTFPDADRGGRLCEQNARVSRQLHQNRKATGARASPPQQARASSPRCPVLFGRVRRVSRRRVRVRLAAHSPTAGHHRERLAADAQCRTRGGAGERSAFGAWSLMGWAARGMGVPRRKQNKHVRRQSD